ncbi:MAG: iron-sulfur cluster assembly scaffold protein [Geminicoccaceae bacterium]
MTDAIYNETIVRTARDRSHAGRLDGADRSVTRDNPLCGDRVTLDLKLAAEAVAEARHKTRGCLLTEAAATLVAARAEGLDPAKAAALVTAVRAFLAGDAPPPWPELAMFEPVRAVRSRHECVLLPFETLAEALQG